MAEIQESGGGSGHKGKKRIKKHSTKVDMTPLVDLACLLITFFMLTSVFSKPKVMEIVFPEKTPEGQESQGPQIPENRAFHIILTEDDGILWYAGMADPTRDRLPELNTTDFSADGIREILLQRNRDLFTELTEIDEGIVDGTIDLPNDTIAAMKRRLRTDDNTGPIVLIKATDGVRYKNMVDIIDEMAITEIARYSIVDINQVELNMVRDYRAALASGGAASNN